VIIHGKESTFLGSRGGEVLVQGGPQHDLDAHEGSQHAFHVLDGLPFAGTKLLNRLEINVGNVLDLDLKSSALLLDGHAGTRVRIRKDDDELVRLLGLAFGNWVGSEEVLAAVVSSVQRCGKKMSTADHKNDHIDHLPGLVELLAFGCGKSGLQTEDNEIRR
jgi:hypothetical protein